MAIPYPFIKVMNGDKSPNLEGIEKKSPKKAMKYLMEGHNMRGKYLGACLDSCRWGSPVTVMWETDVRGLMRFIQRWRDENNDDLNLYHEVPIDRLYTRFELPHIQHKQCPRDEKHRRNFLDAGGRIRCGERSVRRFRPSFIESYAFFDELSQMRIRNFFEEEPTDPSYTDDEGEWVHPEEEYSKYLKAIDRFNLETETEPVVDVCYAIISDKDLVLSFETILQRMNLARQTKTVYCGNDPTRRGCKRVSELDEGDRRAYEFSGSCPGHGDRVKEVVFPFDGWDLAFYLQRWREQADGKAPWFAEKLEEWTPKPMPAYD